MTGDELRAIRKEWGYDRRQDFAVLLGVSRMAIEHWEYGRRKIPKYVLRHIEVIQAVRVVVDHWHVKGSVPRVDLEALERSISPGA